MVLERGHFLPTKGIPNEYLPLRFVTGTIASAENSGKVRSSDIHAKLKREAKRTKGKKEGSLISRPLEVTFQALLSTAPIS